ncbi:hypothetical protein JCM10213_001541 [Rhodosporidiobolus nylandii]
MLDRLPLELVDHAVRLALPLSFSFSQYRERQDTLSALCRTSGAMQAVAQPLLFEVVELRTVNEVERFVEACEATKLGERVRQVRLISENEEEWRSVSLGELEPVATSCPSVVYIHLHGIKLSLASLEPFAHLRTLTLSEAHLSGFLLDRNFQLPSLEELSLIFTSFMPTHISPSHYPALKALHFQNTVGISIEPSLLQEILEQVEVLSCDSSDIGGGAAVACSSGRVLQDWRANNHVNEYAPVVVSLRLHPHASSRTLIESQWPPDSPDTNAEAAYEEYARDFGRMSRLLEDGASPGLRLVILSTSFSGHSPELDAALSRLRAACTARGIEVVDEPPFHPHYDSLVSHEVWRRCKALKADEERAKNDKEEGRE